MSSPSTEEETVDGGLDSAMMNRLDSAAFCSKEAVVCAGTQG